MTWFTSLTGMLAKFTIPGFGIVSTVGSAIWTFAKWVGQGFADCWTHPANWAFIGCLLLGMHVYDDMTNVYRGKYFDLIAQYNQELAAADKKADDAIRAGRLAEDEKRKALESAAPLMSLPAPPVVVPVPVQAPAPKPVKRVAVKPVKTPPTTLEWAMKAVGL